MAVDNPNVIDFISISPEKKVVLTISDHLEWYNDNEHPLLLKDKINSYIEAIENNHLNEIYPDVNDKEIIIHVSLKYNPNKQGEILLDEITNFLKSKNYNFTYSIIT